MALARSLNAVRGGILAHLRVPVSQSVAQHQAAPASWQFVRAFAGTYLDKNDVTERVLSVVKNFDQKVDQTKVKNDPAELYCMHSFSCFVLELSLTAYLPLRAISRGYDRDQLCCVASGDTKL